MAQVNRVDYSANQKPQASEALNPVFSAGTPAHRLKVAKLRQLIRRGNRKQQLRQQQGQLQNPDQGAGQGKPLSANQMFLMSHNPERPEDGMTAEEMAAQALQERAESSPQGPTSQTEETNPSFRDDFFVI
jgi:hypothetical protein